MSRSPLALLFVSATALVAQPASPAAGESHVAAPTAPRTVSPAMADTLKAGLPKSAFVKPAEKKSAEPTPDLRDLDKPRNEIVRLPKYVVREPRPPVFTDRELLGDRAFGEKLARRYYPEWYLAFNRLARWTPLALFMSSAGSSALARFYEDERLRKMGEFADLTNMVMRADPVAGARVKDLTQDMFMRKSDFGWQGGAK